MPKTPQVSMINKDVPAEMVWVDLETTGLVANLEFILEAGIIVTDKFGNERATWSSLVADYGTRSRISFLRSSPHANDKAVYEMHKKSGLIDEILQITSKDFPVADLAEYSSDNVATEALDFLKIAGAPEPKQAPMSGSSVHFDRAFLAERMPQFHTYFHYRNVDVSSVKNICKQLSPDLYKRLGEYYTFDKEHRPIADLRASIAEYKFYVQEFFIW